MAWLEDVETTASGLEAVAIETDVWSEITPAEETSTTRTRPAGAEQRQPESEAKAAQLGEMSAIDIAIHEAKKDAFSRLEAACSIKQLSSSPSSSPPSSAPSSSPRIMRNTRCWRIRCSP